MPEALLSSSPLAPASQPVRIHYREWGTGPAILVLHGGWGYDVYPFDRQIAVLAPRHRVIAPDRTGYGASGTLDVQQTDFHQRAAEETRALLDALDVEEAVLWGHSDGAVIALRLALMAPSRVRGVVAEATHLFKAKPASRNFFETMRDAPERLGERVVAIMRREHGPRWRALISTNGDAWLRIAASATSPTDDLYDGRLSAIEVPVLAIHGGRDPRTEPGELDALRAALSAASGGRAVPNQVIALAEGAHSPHSEQATADAVTNHARTFLERLALRQPPTTARR